MIGQMQLTSSGKILDKVEAGTQMLRAFEQELEP